MRRELAQSLTTTSSKEVRGLLISSWHSWDR